MILLERDPADPVTFSADLPHGWTAGTPEPSDAAELTALLRRHEQAAKGSPSSTEAEVLVEVSPEGASVRHNVVVCDPGGVVRGWASAHDRAAGRMLMSLVVDRRLDDSRADRVALALFEWADEAASRVGAERGLDVQQIDSGAFADDRRQHRWLARAGFRQVRTWWQMRRPVTAGEAGDAPGQDEAGVRVRRVERAGSGMPEEADLRTVHEILESAFADHFNSHAESFEEFLFRLREDPGHRWDHWWVAELVDEETTGAAGVPQAAGTLVGTVVEDDDGAPVGSYVSYIGVLENARGRGVAKALLRTIIADAAGRGRDFVSLEVDADSPTGADGLYLSMGWQTTYVTQSWHREVPVTD